MARVDARRASACTANDAAISGDGRFVILQLPSGRYRITRSILIPPAVRVAYT